MVMTWQYFKIFVRGLVARDFGRLLGTLRPSARPLFAGAAPGECAVSLPSDAVRAKEPPSSTAVHAPREAELKRGGIRRGA